MITASLRDRARQNLERFARSQDREHPRERVAR